MPFQRPKQRDTARTPDEALAKLEHFCAYRERAPQEVRQKMKELNLHGETAEQIYQLLQDEGFFNEERFALSFVRGKFAYNHWGRVRIRLELRLRNIAPALIEQALESIDEAEYIALLKDKMDKKRRQLGGDAQARQKTAAYLIRAGFEQELVFRYL